MDCSLQALCPGRLPFPLQGSFQTQGVNLGSPALLADSFEISELPQELGIYYTNTCKTKCFMYVLFALIDFPFQYDRFSFWSILPMGQSWYFLQDSHHDPAAGRLHGTSTSSLTQHLPSFHFFRLKNENLDTFCWFLLAKILWARNTVPENCNFKWPNLHETSKLDAIINLHFQVSKTKAERDQVTLSKVAQW